MRVQGLLCVLLRVCVRVGDMCLEWCSGGTGSIYTYRKTAKNRKILRYVDGVVWYLYIKLPGKPGKTGENWGAACIYN